MRLYIVLFQGLGPLDDEVAQMIICANAQDFYGWQQNKIILPRTRIAFAKRFDASSCGS
jgi:hypothetical protein